MDSNHHKPEPSQATLQASVRHTVYIFHHTSSWQPHQPTATTAEPIRIIGLAIRILYLIRSLCCRRAATIFGLQFSQSSLGLALLPSSLIALIGTYLVGCRWFGNYRRQIAVLAALFHAASFHSLFSQVSFAAVSAQGFARPLAGLLATHLAIVFQYIQPTYRVCTLHDPRRLWKVADSNRLLT